MSEISLEPQEPSSIRLVMSLAVAGFLSGIIIISIFEATLSTITENKARELREAVFRVLPGATQMQPMIYEDNLLVVARGKTDPDETIYAGYDEQGNFVGYAISNKGPGFQDTIHVIYGYAPAKRQIIGMWILDSRETPGLGDKIYKDAAFVAEFDALSIEPTVKSVKKGTKTSNNRVDSITGATISSKAVVRIINEGNAVWLGRLPNPGSEAAFEEVTGGQ
ncbi:hypothetical protein BOW53_11675 [Solemya pervernicosa gill symbiont]|uniref:Ion-translocating oxidoreductase complex subunit G n=2 Tax=Gammaproteobacteria incertae sedis TaxID=118884 RepID=A0A1T2L2V8_9GAMM|nr:FMN-binding protein [Candidatus Reidiella endopervernicosa]OOZ39411.1 hypothetical protein BOW53_11675 [Solemya pervernicosa gill symbiont]QKQ26934.1 FMN-binding protein [Candidatus Reidiella endopervernicosa]